MSEYKQFKQPKPDMRPRCKHLEGAMLAEGSATVCQSCEIERLKESLKGQTGFCINCERTGKELASLKKLYHRLREDSDRVLGEQSEAPVIPVKLYDELQSKLSTALEALKVIQGFIIDGQTFWSDTDWMKKIAKSAIQAIEDSKEGS